MDLFHPIHVHADPALSTGAVVWRYRGALHLTAIVKATFAAPIDGPMSIAEPEALLAEDLRLDGRLARPSDRVPYRSRADVLVHAPSYPAGKPARFSLRGRAGHVLERALSAGEDAARLGPVARAWPTTHVLEIPQDFDWAQMQAAHPDQQTGYLRGDEWLVAEGLHPTLDVVSTRLPDVRATGVAHAGSGSQPWSQPLTLNADLVLLDLAEGRCAIVWRGVLPLSSLDQLAAIRLDLGIELAGRPLRSAAQPAQPPPAARRPSPSGHSFEQTTAITPPAAAPTPTSASRFEGTMDLSAAVTGAGSAMPAPFPIGAGSASERALPIAGAPWSAARATPAPAPRHDFEHTLTIREGTAAPIAGAPWSTARATPAPAPRDDFEHTLTLRDGSGQGALPTSVEPPAAIYAPSIALPPIAVPARPAPPVAPQPPVAPPALLAAPAPTPARDVKAQISRRLPKRKA